MMTMYTVTILILVDGFLQYSDLKEMEIGDSSHNPYVSRWFSAIISQYEEELLYDMSQSLF